MDTGAERQVTSTRMPQTEGKTIGMPAGTEQEKQGIFQSLTTGLGAGNSNGLTARADKYTHNLPTNLPALGGARVRTCSWQCTEAGVPGEPIFIGTEGNKLLCCQKCCFPKEMATTKAKTTYPQRSSDWLRAIFND